jgi:predicted transcriptional regulator
MNFKEDRSRLGLSQAKLARLSGVSRFKICPSELGDSRLTSDEQAKLRSALQAEAERLRTTAASVESGHIQAEAAQ